MSEIKVKSFLEKNDVLSMEKPVDGKVSGFMISI